MNAERAGIDRQGNRFDEWEMNFEQIHRDCKDVDNIDDLHDFIYCRSESVSETAGDSMKVGDLGRSSIAEKGMQYSGSLSR